MMWEQPAEEVKMARRERRKFSDGYKAEVVALVRSSDKSVGAISRDLVVTETTVHEWVKRADVDGGKRKRPDDGRAWRALAIATPENYLGAAELTSSWTSPAGFNDAGSAHTIYWCAVSYFGLSRSRAVQPRRQRHP
jgi:transposase-like protein